MGIALYDVQLLAGIALQEGKLVEMQTGEGKTLAAVLPAYLYALQGHGAHVVTFNDYLARRDAEWMGPVYRFLGLNACFVRESGSAAERQAAYAADVTYLTAKEAGFDYLRDSLCCDAGSLVQRPFHFVLVDEADSILIDEARVPMVIAGESGSAGRDAGRMSELARRLARGLDYDTDEAKRNVYLTEAGADKVEALLGCGNLYDIGNSETLAALHCALHAEALLRKDVEYVIRAGKVELIDGLTGRIADQRRWPDGLQTAVEAKEELKPQPGGCVLGSITMRHLLSLYPKLCGMTATARSSADEFEETYGLDVVVAPPNRPCIRMDHPHAVFTHKEAKRKALVNDIVSFHRIGRPVLIGTASVEESDGLAAGLRAAGVPCSVLNAKNDEMEAELIAQAGTWGAVTVSTNMAGRGVDIRLGGGDVLQAAAIAELGGLVVLGTTLHESARIDHQLRGRAGRQGDPGCSRFYASLEDDLLSRFGIASAIPADMFSMKRDEPLEGAVIQRSIAHIQRVADGQNREIRKTLHRYSDMLEQQRRIVHGKRRDLLTDRIEPVPPFASVEPARYERLCGIYGAAAVREAEKRFTLLAIDRCWADYLDYAAYVRESIHLESIGGNRPLDTFHRLILEAFDGFHQEVEKRVRKALSSVDTTKDRIQPDQAVMHVPSATWTYLINDQFFPNRVSFW
jgi:preprotein translocase subunit SecA